MKSYPFKCFSIILILALALPGNLTAAAAVNIANSSKNHLPTSQDPNQPAAFSITGQVKDEYGGPLQGVMVKATLFTGNILVLDNQGNPVSGAQIFTSSNFLGVTDSKGILASPNIQAGDSLVARKLVEETPTSKVYHNANSNQNWAYRTYITSLDIPKNGEPNPYIVANASLTQTLTIKKTNTLIGFNLVVSVDWDADSNYLADLQQAFAQASSYLYDASNGQMLFEQVSIYDDNFAAPQADFYFQANNQLRPTAQHAGLFAGGTSTISLGRYFNGYTSNAGNWFNPEGFRTLVYEFSQYAMGLYDSSFFYDIAGKRQNSACTSASIRSDANDATNATLMYWRYNASEFAQKNVAGLWSASCENSLQMQKNQASDWQTIQAVFADVQNPARFQLLTPADYGQVVPGPTILAVSSWSSVTIANDASSGACTIPITVQVLDDLGQPVPAAEVIVVNPVRIIPQGKTDNQGNIEILGAGTSDLVVADAWNGRFLSGSIQISCSLLKPAGPISLAVQPAGFSLQPSIQLSSVGQNLSIQIQSSVPLTMPLNVTFSQTGEPTSSQVNMNSADHQTWSGSTNLASGNPQAGSIYISGSFAGSSVQNILHFQAETVNPTTEALIHSKDGLAELTMPPNVLSGNSKFALINNELVITPTQGVTMLSGPYLLQPGDGMSLQAPVNLALAYDDPNGALRNLDKRIPQIARWNGKKWIAVSDSQPSNTDPLVSAVITQAGIYALVINSTHSIYLPFVARSNPPVGGLKSIGLYAPGLETQRLVSGQSAPQVVHSIVYSIATNAMGYYTFTNIAAGLYTLEVIQPGRTFTPTLRQVNETGASGQDFIRLSGSNNKGETVFVPGGSFQMGCDSQHNGGFSCNFNNPLHTVILDSFFLSKYLITTSQYAQCVSASQCTPPAILSSGSGRPSYYGNPLFANYPVIYISWAQASNFCTWTGGNLPTEAQWEKAARGLTPRAYPWGDITPTCNLANYGQNPPASYCFGNTTPVTSSLGVSPYGAMDMAGNVQEWVKDWFDPNYYNNAPVYNPPGPSQPPINPTRGVRGGSWALAWYYLLTSYRGSSNPTLYFSTVGFRCAYPTP